MFYSGAITTETTVIYSPVRMVVDAVAVDLATGKRFVVGANTGAIVLTTFENMVPGDVVRIEFDASSAQSLAFSTGAFGATALINADGEWFEVTKTDLNDYVITAGNFS